MEFPRPAFAGQERGFTGLLDFQVLEDEQPQDQMERFVPLRGHSSIPWLYHSTAITSHAIHRHQDRSDAAAWSSESYDPKRPGVVATPQDCNGFTAVGVAISVDAELDCAPFEQCVVHYGPSGPDPKVTETGALVSRAEIYAPPGRLEIRATDVATGRLTSRYSLTVQQGVHHDVRLRPLTSQQLEGE